MIENSIKWGSFPVFLRFHVNFQESMKFETTAFLGAALLVTGEKCAFWKGKILLQMEMFIFVFGGVPF